MSASPATSVGASTQVFHLGRPSTPLAVATESAARAPVKASDGADICMTFLAVAPGGYQANLAVVERARDAHLGRPPAGQEL